MTWGGYVLVSRGSRVSGHQPNLAGESGIGFFLVGACRGLLGTFESQMMQLFNGHERTKQKNNSLDKKSTLFFLNFWGEFPPIYLDWLIWLIWPCCVKSRCFVQVRSITYSLTSSQTSICSFSSKNFKGSLIDLHALVSWNFHRFTVDCPNSFSWCMPPWVTFNDLHRVLSHIAWDCEGGVFLAISSHFGARVWRISPNGELKEKDQKVTSIKIGGVWQTLVMKTEVSRGPLFF